MAELGLRFCARAFSSCGKWGPLLIAVRGPLTIAASPVVEHRLQTRRLSSCGSQAQLLRGMWDLPRPGLEPVSPALAGGFSTTAPPGKPLSKYFYSISLDLVGLWTGFSKMLYGKDLAQRLYTTYLPICVPWGLRWCLSLDEMNPFSHRGVRSKPNTETHISPNVDGMPYASIHIHTTSFFICYVLPESLKYCR